MKEYTEKAAMAHLREVMDIAKTEGAVLIRRMDGQAFVLTVERAVRKPSSTEPSFEELFSVTRRF